MNKDFFKKAYDEEINTKKWIDGLIREPVSWITILIGSFLFLVRIIEIKPIEKFEEINLKATISGIIIISIIILIIFLSTSFFKMFYVLGKKKYHILDITQVVNSLEMYQNHYTNTHLDTEGAIEEDIKKESEFYALNQMNSIVNKSYKDYSIHNQNINIYRIKHYYYFRMYFVISIVLVFVLTLLNYKSILNG